MNFHTDNIRIYSVLGYLESQYYVKLLLRKKKTLSGKQNEVLLIIKELVVFLFYLK